MARSDSVKNNANGALDRYKSEVTREMSRAENSGKRNQSNMSSRQSGMENRSADLSDSTGQTAQNKRAGNGNRRSDRAK